jgi:hypothetical protein
MPGPDAPSIGGPIVVRLTAAPVSSLTVSSFAAATIDREAAQQ